MRSNIFDRLSFISLFSVIVLLPLFCLPFTNIPVEISKGLLLVVGLVLSIIFWAIARFIDGKIILPKSRLLVSGFGIAVVFLVSALFSGSPQVSLFGNMFDVGSFWFIFSAYVFMLMSSIIFRTPRRAKIVIFGIIISSVLVLIFQSVHLFMPNILSLGILSGKTGNVLGSWNALGLFAGFASLAFILVVEFFQISKILKLILSIFILLGILLATTVNFMLVWALLGIFSLVIFVYKSSINLERNEDEELEKKEKHFPMVSFIVVIISLLFFLSAGSFSNIIPNRLQISNTEVNPNFLATMSITKGVLQKHPLFGIGPNRFGEAWAMYKPISINNTQFFDTYFNSGSGLLPTLTATTGGFGILAFLVFFILFLIIGVKSVFSSIKNKVNFEMVSFFVLSIYLFISSFFYSGGAVIFLLAFAFTGVFVGLANQGGSKEISISFLNNQRKSFFSIFFLILLVILSVAAAYKYIERFVSISYFGKALTASTIEEAEMSIGKALALYQNDLYLRAYSQIYLAELNSIAEKDSTLSDEDKADLQVSLDQAVNGAQMAVAYDSSNYLNFQSLGSVYHMAGILGVKDTYSKAIEYYMKASALNPNNPAILFTISKIAKTQGDITLALNYAEKALSVSPIDSDLIKYVDSLKNELNISTPTPTPKKQ